LLGTTRYPAWGPAFSSHLPTVGITHGKGQLVADGDDVYLGTDNGAYAPFVRASHDGGVTWQAPVMVYGQNVNGSEPVLRHAP
jgi:hypothetical protein